jgi:hypothetical protein
MPTQPGGPQQADGQEMRRARLLAAIGEQVLAGLGEPDDLHGVQVRPLWERHYRVNILAFKAVTSARIAHGYFLMVDGDGKIVRSAPGVLREY